MRPTRARKCVTLAAAIAALSASTSLTAQQSGPGSQWISQGGEKTNTKYAALDQIDRTNVGDLQIAWRWKEADHSARPGADSRATPLLIDGVLYIPFGLNEVAAINAKTGETIWIYSFEGEPSRRNRPGRLRGVAYWSDGEEQRIFMAASDARLIALNAKTGSLIRTFGDGGAVNLREGLGRPIRGRYSVNSPPIVVRDVVVVGSVISDGASTQEMPPGHVRGFDARTGEMRWIFHTIPQEGEFGVETWENDSWRYTGNANVWSLMSADEELGYVYLPLTTPSNDWYGGHRLGDNLFAESVVCLDAETGERVWHFQTVHHGLWDYDNPAGPVLCDITVDGREIKAIVQVTKQGFCFVFDRVTGEPVWPIEELEVPQSDVPGERTSPTQPHPTKPPPFERQGMSEDELIDFTPELRAEAVEILSHYRYGQLFMPPSLIEEDGTKGTINFPGWGGGANWGGAAFDPETGMLYVPSRALPIAVGLAPPDSSRSDFRYRRAGGIYIDGPQGLPLIKPPYGQISAIDLNKGDIVWQVPNGRGPDAVLNHPLLKDMDLPMLGQTARAAPLLTKTLLFVGEGAGLSGGAFDQADPILRAFDKATGETIAEIELPGNTSGSPMTYMIDGKQYIVVAVAVQNASAELIALSLP